MLKYLMAQAVVTLTSIGFTVCWFTVQQQWKTAPGARRGKAPPLPEIIVQAWTRGKKALPHLSGCTRTVGLGELP